MTIKGEYVPSPTEWVRKQVEAIEAAGDTRAAQVMDRDVVMLTMLGVSGKVRKVPLMRVEHDGSYAAVASKGGAPENPKWYANVKKNPVLDLMDGTETFTVKARELSGAEREEWWERCVAAYPPYAEYQTKTDRQIPVLILEPITY
ncbi:nitroreductase family deazaflavin-dependent oxidoreductase [Enemella evansiae]|uniref:nitroreductase family deazaflavin-dependent oxidoreductase n=1 Tax=Enemella evansiae TaxID=2016499 RepID=UPI000B97B19E|nr:nitroreductase family deazaflavin-dependent oxidoreductase [Enemella evansiae]OYN93692.1 nitroreductase [Enemella evansiae]OYN97349.1 nitroreductase [Enemella evansiae]OYO05731.1 nitroreductase [Enemella evansiae]PFG66749.1 deazaflavin-dependent oxidoreductase (nitroreductase family) [Propionibacteriaceae bacterium ES.041]